MPAPRPQLVLHVARNDVRLLLRDRGTLFWSFIGPLLFIFAFGILFKNEPPAHSTLLYLRNEDRSETLAQALALLLRDDGVRVRIATADTVLRATTYRLVVAAGTSDSLAAGRPPRLVLHVPTEEATPREQSLKAQIVRASMSAFLGLAPADAQAALDTTAVRARIAFEPRVRLVKRALAAPAQSAGFQRTVPSYLVMFLLMTLMTSGAELLILERRAGLLRRTLVASVQSNEVVLGKFMARFAFAWLQIAVMLAAGLFLFHVRLGAHTGALLAVLMAFAFCATGLGVLFATFFRNPDQASGVGVLLILVMAALGGCWWPLEIVPKWMAKIAWGLPTGWAFDALNRVMALDAGVLQVSRHLIVLFGIAAVTLPLAARRLQRCN